MSGQVRKGAGDWAGSTAVAVARMLLVNASENYKDPNSFWTSHSDLTQLHPS